MTRFYFVDRGTCKDFFCHCEPPYWGVGCGKDTPYLPTNKSKTVDGFKIYAYDLPAWLAYQHAYYAGWQDHDRIYVAYREVRVLFFSLHTPFDLDSMSEGPIQKIKCLN